MQLSNLLNNELHERTKAERQSSRSISIEIVINRTKSPMLIVPSRIPWLHIIIAVDKAALKITFCPKFSDDKLV